MSTTTLIILAVVLIVAVLGVIIFLFISLQSAKKSQQNLTIQSQSLVSPQEIEKLVNEQKTTLQKQFQQEMIEKTEAIKADKQAQLDEYKQEIRSRSQERETSIREELARKNGLISGQERLAIQQELQREEEKLRQQVIELQLSLEKKETALEDKITKLEQDRARVEEFRQQLVGREQILNQSELEITSKETLVLNDAKAKLVEIAGLSPQEARAKVLEEAQKEMGEELLSWQNKYLSNFEEQANERAMEITTLAIQRCSSEVANEFTITSVKLKGEEEKGKLIGKQGRNLQWLEKTLGVELIIDDTPETVTISGFSSVRRHIAKRTLERLLEDGRVHPASIEEMYDKSKNEIAGEIADAGQWAMNELGIYDFPAKLIRIIGRLKFRTGYGQNVLKHSVEMAKLAGLLADGLNAEFPNSKPIDRMICVKGALLHDIGKAVDEEMTPKGNHIEIGEKICDMFDLDWKIKKCISSHHTTGGDRESYMDKDKGVCLEAAVVDACDTLSGGRPGARKETAEAYFQRMEALENVAKKVPGVTKSWIMRGARELWVFFDANELNPTQVHRATRKLAREINDTIKTPQEIKIIGFREDRVVEYSR